MLTIVRRTDDFTRGFTKASSISGTRHQKHYLAGQALERERGRLVRRHRGHSAVTTRDYSFSEQCRLAWCAVLSPGLLSKWIMITTVAAVR